MAVYAPLKLVNYVIMYILHVSYRTTDVDVVASVRDESAEVTMMKDGGRGVHMWPAKCCCC